MNKQEQEFKELMRNYRTERAPLDFSKRVMDEIYQVEKLMAQQPVFNKWFLGLMSLVFTFFIAVAIWGGNPGEPQEDSSKVGQFMQSITEKNSLALDSANHTVANFFNSIPPVLIFALLGILLLLVLDRFLQHRKNVMKNQN